MAAISPALHANRKLIVGALIALASIFGNLAFHQSARAQQSTDTHALDTPLTRIAFGSCVRQDRAQPIWKAVIDADPQVFVLAGDNIYGDTEDIEILKAKYQLLDSQPDFARLRATRPLFGTWDDHDYGVNDGGREYPQREASQQVMLDFFQVPAESPRRGRPGVYDSVLLGPPERRVQLILLDTRYFRSPLERVTLPVAKGRGPYAANSAADATMLGEEQWRWLEATLREPAQVRLIVSSIQVAAIEHGWEGWGTMPAERERLFRLLRDTQARGVILLSGDRHLAELSRIEPSESGLEYPLYDLTSSSLNQPSGGQNAQEPNARRVGQNYLQVNFGMIELQWPEQLGQPPQVTLTIRDVQGQVVLSHAVESECFQPAAAAR